MSILCILYGEDILIIQYILCIFFGLGLGVCRDRVVS
jgi:hypothetical protein